MKAKTLLLTLFAAGATVAQAGAPLEASLDSIFEARYPRGCEEPGGAVVISRGDSVIYERYFGVADMESREPISQSTRFCIASVSKQFTVVGLLRLAAAGLLDIDAPMSKYFPEYKSGIWQRLTPRHLASQSSGIPDLRDRSCRDACLYATDESSVEYFADLDTLLFEPGTAYDYVNPTFLLLARIIERVSGENFIDYQRKHILDPAGMDSSYYFDPARPQPGRSHGYEPTADGDWREYDYGEETFFATRPDGALYATARDMANWEHALLGGLLPADWLAMAYRPHTDVASSTWCDYQRRPSTWYGLGWFIEHRPDSPLKIFHTGDNGGYQAYVAKYPSTGVSVVVLENRHDRSRRDMSMAVEEILIKNGLIKAD